MLRRDLITKLLNIRKTEIGKVLVMTGHAFFSGLGIALAFSAINLLLLKKHGTEILPVIYMVAMVFLLIMGHFYQRLEHKLNPSRLFTIVVLFMTTWALVSFMVIGKGSFWITAGIYCTYFLIYLLHNLEFWGASALLFDLRESKRVFGFLNSGESLAKILGYALTPIIVSLLDESYLLLAACGAFLMSLVMWQQVVRKHRSEFKVSHHHDHELESIQSRTELKSGLLRRSSQLALLGALVLTLVQFAFLKEVDKTFSSSTQLALYFGLFFSTAKFFNLFLELTVSGRLLERIGLSRSILMLPLILVFFSILGVTAGNQKVFGLEALFFLFAFMTLSDEILSTAVHKPAFLSLFQPLTKDGRLLGHSISKGISEPIGIGLAGIILWLLMQTQSFSLLVVAVCIFLFGIFWIISGLSTGRVYKMLVEKMMKTRLLDNSHLESILNSDVDLDTRINEEGEPLNKLYLLQLAKGHFSEETHLKCLKELLSSNAQSSTLVETLKYIEKNPVEGIDVRSLTSHRHELVRQASVVALAALEKDNCTDELLSIKDKQPELKQAIYSALLKNGGLYAASIVGGEVIQLSKSEDPDDRIQACRILEHTGIRSYYQPLLYLLEDKFFEVRVAAVAAAGEIRHQSLVVPLIRIALTSGLFDDVFKSLQKFESLSAGPFIDSMSQTTDLIKKKRLIRLLSCNSNFDDQDLGNHLIPFLTHTYETRKEAINTMFNLGLQVDDPMVLENEWNHEYASILNLKHLKLQGLIKEASVLQALDEELRAKTILLLKITGLIYDRSLLFRAIDSYSIGSKLELANTIEALDLLLSDRHRKKMMRVMEADIQLDRKHDLAYYIDLVFNSSSHLHSDFFKAMIVRMIGKSLEKIDLFKPLAKETISPILQEEFSLLSYK